MSTPKPDAPAGAAAATGAEQEPPCCCACCCCECCKPDPNPIPQHLRDGDVFSERSCTDCPMVIVYLLFLIGWIVIIAVAGANGKPERIFLPENFRGELCGDAGTPLASYNTFFAPLPSRPSYGFCTKKCPSVGDVVCNNDVEVKVGSTDNQKVANHFYSHTAEEFRTGLADATKCKVSCNSAERTSADRYIAMRVKMDQKKCFLVFYPSKPSLQRCIPSLSGNGAETANVSLMAAINETTAGLSALKDTLGASSFFTLGFAEIKQTWLVILVASFTCMFIACVWVFLLRWVLAPLTYLCIVLILGVFIALGFIFKFFADDLEAGALPGETGTDNQIIIWRACEYISFLIAAMYFVIMLYMLKRIRIAIAVMEEASSAFIASPSMVLIPIFTFIVLIGWIAFAIITTIYIQTMGEFTTEAVKTTAQNYAGDSVNVTDLFEKQSSGSSLVGGLGSGDNAPVLNVSRYTVQDRTKILHAYNIFGILWTGNFCMMLGFFMMSMTVCAWYFSATQVQMADFVQTKDQGEEAHKGRAKGTPNGVILKALSSTFCNHLGTVLWGALLIAIMQFIRAIFLYLSENYLKEFKESATGSIVLKCVDCCLWYIEQVVRIISKNAFIICVIRCTNFCSSAAEACAVLLANAARISILAMLSTAAIFLVKVFIVGSNMLIAYGLMRAPALTEDKPVESGLFPMFLILLMSFAIASLFLNVYEACIDTIFMCFLMDEKYFNGDFMPESLAKIVDLFKGAEEARLRYEKEMNDAQKKAEAGGF